MPKTHSKGHKRLRSISADMIRAWFDYEPSSGILRYRPRTHPTSKLWNAIFAKRVGRRAGTVQQVGSTLTDRRIISLGHNGKMLSAPVAAVAFIWVTGKWPAHEMDHRDHNTLNDRWCNLREATKAQNLCNRRVLRKTKSGYKGVYEKNGRYRASITSKKVARHIGAYSTPIAAALAYDAEALRLHGPFASLNFPQAA